MENTNITLFSLPDQHGTWQFMMMGGPSTTFGVLTFHNKVCPATARFFNTAEEIIATLEPLCLPQQRTERYLAALKTCGSVFFQLSNDDAIRIGMAVAQPIQMPSAQYSRADSVAQRSAIDDAEANVKNLGHG